MLALSSSLRLPVSLLLLLAAQVKDINADQGLPTAIRKMGSDPGEKFLDEYLGFAAGDEVTQVGTQARAAVPASGVLTAEEEEPLAANASASIPFRAPFAAHFFSGVEENLEDRDARDVWDLYRRAKLIEVRLGKRAYACPTGTSDCSSIGYPDSCCQSGTTCVKITDTGLGSVGCCPDSESCSGSIACSGSQQGCSSESGGGCCIDGFACASVGCKSIRRAPSCLLPRRKVLISNKPHRHTD
ncbi:hypothetical protein M406DRAFT_268299 [Cryphonectria parasitica EP155]|uniref:Uncharacterized protein n=1 Tax=Cryphonectria parasitica (strain ATCC 38755 / EP155) TaxID=660469 RepID=A0A9P5CKG1_CRYP1|nr:uncharacterized protein M406DRAFT_268299 [Cryphonectria parasitica EP155]KAF3761132.1 hypothetical protein M406DRAFT_268299 [Cryphonectria parasitica EP155]